MKNAFATVVLLLTATSVIAQEKIASLDPPDLIVIEKSWHKEPRAGAPNSNPLGPNEALIQQTRAEKTEIRNREYSLPNQPTEPRMPSPGARPIPPPTSVTTRYVYKIKVKNNGPKTIKSVDWEYQFLDLNSNEVMGYRRMTSNTKLSPGKIKVLERSFTRQPTILVNADSLDKKYKDQFTERLIIHRIQYTDGSVWQRPSTQ
jgi:hypothetical protein